MLGTRLDSFLPSVSPLVLYYNVGAGLEVRAVGKFHVCNQVCPKTFHCLRTVVKGSLVGILRTHV